MGTFCCKDKTQTILQWNFTGLNRHGYVCYKKQVIVFKFYLVSPGYLLLFTIYRFKHSVMTSLIINSNKYKSKYDIL